MTEGIEALLDYTAGDEIEGVDELCEELNSDEQRFEVDYKNLYTDNTGYLAEVYAGDRKVAVVGSLGGFPMIRKIYKNKVNDIICESVEESDISKMLHKEGFKSLEVDKEYNTITIVDNSGDAITTISLDLIHEAERLAEKSEHEVVAMERE